jgi:hypothetical protein
MMFSFLSMNIFGKVVVVTGFVRFICSTMFIFQLVNIIATILNGIAG